MKSLLTSTLFFSVFTFCCAQSDEEAIKKVITTAYIGGIHNNGNVDDIRRGFHPTFTMLRFIENDVKPYPIEEWIADIEKRRKENGPVASKAEGKFVSVDVTGNASVVKLDLFRDGKKIFTDYLVLYKFTEGWRIVSKSFYRHP